MRKSMSSFACLLLACLISLTSIAQNVTITGNVKNGSNKENVAAVSVVVKGTTIGAFTDDNGNFRLTVAKLPVTLVISSVGFETTEVTVSGSEKVAVELTAVSSLGQEVVVAATRTSTRLLESPVSIERIGTAAIRNASAASYYDIIRNAKGVDVTNSSLTFTTVTTRGFNGSGSARVNQVVDGMDNQAPGLNFSVGNIVGVTELDVESMELLPGASSALYGPGGMNGTVLINSKNPFKYQGLSAQIKTGMMHTDQRERPTGAYHDWSVRWGKVIGEKFAFKINAQLLQAKDWIGDDFRNYSRLGSTGSVIPGTRETDPNYDGINVYGDETTRNLRSVATAGGNVDIYGAVAAAIGAQQPSAVPVLNYIMSSLPNTINVSRTGYTERELLDNNTTNFKLSGGLFYKITNKLEVSWLTNWGTGNTVYTGSERYSIKDFKMGQHKLEFKSKNWFLRGYTTQENAGGSHNSTITAQLFNEAWKPSATWYQQYVQGYLVQELTDWTTAYTIALQGGQSQAQAQAAAFNAIATTNPLKYHNVGRALADQGRPVSGTDLFRNLYNKVSSDPIPIGGLLLDRSDLWGAEGQYNFQDIIKFVDVLVGANWKQYVLNSKGTLFIDYNGPIKINEYGGYVQLTKRLFNERLILSASGRYDKNDNFKERFTPRATAVIKVAKNNNIRLSYQTAYRFPTTQQQYINLVVGSGVFLAGGLPWVQDLYNLKNNPGFQLENVLAGNFTPYKFKEFKPEVASTYEVGYKSLVKNKLLLDAYGYVGEYKDFIGRIVLLQRKAGAPQSQADFLDFLSASKRNAIGIVTNSDTKVTTWGWGFGMDYNFVKFWNFNFNVSSDNIEDVPSGFVSNFNTPKYRFNLGLTSTGLGKTKQFGFSINFRWQDDVKYESDFANDRLPAFNTIDAQVNYKVPKIKSVFKIGANNLLNQYYRNGVGNPAIGGLYYVSFGYNVF
ncbi:MAG: TonB-dependent receptor [Sphingobacteriales bacterium]|nr:MAG: TonB-dependent receptor [Sphingobacteriales bacterium]